MIISIGKNINTTNGGSGTTNFDWTSVGYAMNSEESNLINNGLIKAQEIFKNWQIDKDDYSNEYSGDSSIVVFPNVDMTNVSTLSNTFYNCQNLIYFPAEIIIGKSTAERGYTPNISFAFDSCTSLKNISLNCAYIFYANNVLSNCTYLESVILKNSGNITDFSSAFYGCNNLNEVVLTYGQEYEASSVYEEVNCNYMFENCNNLKVCPQIIKKIYTAEMMFSNCLSLETIPELYFQDGANINYLFGNNSPINLKNLGGFVNLQAGIDLSYSINLTKESLMNVINKMADLTGQSSQTLILGADNLAKLNDDEKAIATNKNWILA